MRSMMKKFPSSSILPTSPECSHPSASMVGRGLLRPAEVSPHPLRATHPQLTHSTRPDVPSGVWIHKPALGVGDQLADGARHRVDIAVRDDAVATFAAAGR
jgi:hypothetical protein